MLNRSNSIRIALTVTLLAAVLALSVSTAFYNSSMVDGFMALALAGAMVTLLVVQPLWINLFILFLFGMVLSVLDYVVMCLNHNFFV